MVEKVVQKVGEHPQCELKRSSRLDTIAQKIEFVKDIQSIATSRIETEKYLVIGVDEASRSFCAVANLDDFDDTRIRQLLGKYLTPVPEFELFRLKSSDGADFVLFVVRKQPIRRILAKCTVVDDKSDPPQKLLLREGDLWTKGSSSGKRLATAEDWDEIYEEVIEREAEKRASRRTVHLMDRVVAQERLRASSGVISMPSFTTDEEFGALVEHLCSSGDKDRFKLLLERLRDDLVEAWHAVGAYENRHELINSRETLLPFIEKLADHKKNVFMPAMRRLASAGILVVKNGGPVRFLEQVLDLLKEVFESSHQLSMMQTAFDMENVFRQYQQGSPAMASQHLSHTVPALESLISLHLIGGYIFKRNRYEYVSTLFRADVYQAGPRIGDQAKRTLMCFWPLFAGRGEPEQLNHVAGRINLCADRVSADQTFLRLFGSQRVAIDALCQYEFCLELNSYLSVSRDVSPATVGFVADHFPNIAFSFWPSLIAFPFRPIMPLALKVYREILARQSEFLKLLVFDPRMASVFTSNPGGRAVYGRFLKGLVSEQQNLFLQQHRFPPMDDWPKELKELMISK
ncbi:MAG: hypothetical protein WCD04_06975 [Terriglobia bacterium]